MDDINIIHEIDSLQNVDCAESVAISPKYVE